MLKEKYKRWGFSSNPFQVVPLKPDWLSSELLVGRGKIKEKIVKSIQSNSGIVSIEGVNGIGKTSLLNVVSYFMYEYSLNHSSDVLYVPCIDIFQLREGQDLEKFSDDIFFQIAQTLIKKATELKTKKGSIPDTKYLDVWLNSTELQSIQVQVAGIGGGQSRTLNNSGGYLSSGFKMQVRNLLNEIFPTNEDGGIICILDNLELLESSKSARKTIDYLRDNVININGTKWVFSGSNGIISSIIKSTRMAGFLQEPLIVRPIKSTFVTSFLTQRINVYRPNKEVEPYLPFEIRHFKILYNELNGNLRDTLQKIGNYCSHVDLLEKEPHFPSEKNSCFLDWLKKLKIKTYTDVKNSLSEESLFVLENIMENKGRLSLSQLAYKHGIESTNTIEDLVKELDRNGLISLNIYEREQFEKSFGTYIVDDSEESDLVSQQELTRTSENDEKDSEDISDFYELEYIENDEMLDHVKIFTISPRGSIIADLLKNNK